jgi:hypothetical protein
MITLKPSNLEEKFLDDRYGNPVIVELVDVEEDKHTGEKILIFRYSITVNTASSIRHNIQKIKVSTLRKYEKRRNLTTFEKIAQGGKNIKPLVSLKKRQNVASLAEIQHAYKASGQANQYEIEPYIANQCQFCSSVNASILSFSSDLIETLSHQKKRVPPIGLEGQVISLEKMYNEVSLILEAGGSLAKTFDYENSKITGQSSVENYYEQKGDSLEKKTIEINGAQVLDTPIMDFLPKNSHEAPIEKVKEMISQMTIVLDQSIQTFVGDLYGEGELLTNIVHDNIEEILTASQLYGKKELLVSLDDKKAGQDDYKKLYGSVAGYNSEYK